MATIGRKDEVLPNPDPSVMTTEAIDRAVINLEQRISSRIAGIEKGVEVFHADLVRVPTLLDRSVLGLREIIETRLDGTDLAVALLRTTTDKFPAAITCAVKQLQELHEEKFASVQAQITIQFSAIATQFQERDKRTEQLSLADKTAIAAALQAQKEAAGAQNESNAAANVKMETNFAKLIEQGQVMLSEMRRNFELQLNDIKSRLDKGEGHIKGTADNTSFILALVMAGVAIASLAVLAFKVVGQ